MKKVHVLVLGILVLLCAAAASASPTDDAANHFKAVAGSDVDATMRPYAEGAVLQWVGGPLDGVYAGPAAIREVWTKFAKANAPLTIHASMIESHMNPKGATVTANVVYTGKTTIKVRQVLTFRGDRLVNEVWQVAPDMNVPAY